MSGIFLTEEIQTIKEEKQLELDLFNEYEDKEIRYEDRFSYNDDLFK